jgi:hypothetical protein
MMPHPRSHKGVSPEYLTEDERRAIRALKRLGKIWPESLELLSMNGRLYVTKPGDTPMTKPGAGRNPDTIVEEIHGIENDGGDW